MASSGLISFLQETNENQAILYANYGILGLGFDFNSRAKLNLKNVTVEDIQNCAIKYFAKPSVTAVLRP